MTWRSKPLPFRMYVTYLRCFCISLALPDRSLVLGRWLKTLVGSASASNAG